jgi:hypothetical protein
MDVVGVVVGVASAGATGLGTEEAVGVPVGVVAGVDVGADVGVDVGEGGVLEVVASGVGVTSSAITCDAPNGVSARATATTAATETAGYAATARPRIRRELSLSMHFTGDSRGSLMVGRHRVVRQTGPPDVR